MDHGETSGVVGRPVAGGLGQQRGEWPVDLDRDHSSIGRRRVQQRQRQRPEPRTDLEHDLVMAQVGDTRDAPHGVGVDDEVLPALLARSQPETGRECSDLGRTQQPAVRGRTAQVGRPSDAAQAGQAP